MIEDKSIYIVIPAWNEEAQLPAVLASVPEFVDVVLVVDDGSEDDTADVVQNAADPRIRLLQHEKNRGPGAAIATGYLCARDERADITVVIDGDGQMKADEIRQVIDPILCGETDYVKGNRLAHGEAYSVMPKVRFFSNAVLSLLTKIVSGYWHIADSQSGFTAISVAALDAVDWKQLYPRYGYPNDVLVKLNIEDIRVRNVSITPVYRIGERSKLNPALVLFPIAFLLIRLFCRRMWQKYVIRDFNPLVFFYGIGLGTASLSFLLVIRMCYYWWCVTGLIPKVNALAVFAGFLASAIFTLFAMWFDMTRNSHLR